MHVLITCNLSAPNPSDVVKAIAQIENIDLSVVSESGDYPKIPELDSKRIHSYTPRRAWSLNMIDPIEVRRCRNLINEINPDLMVSFGASNLLFTSVVADFTPAVFIPQGGETARAIGDYYQREGTLRQLRNRTTYRWAFKRLLDHVDEVWTGKPTIPVFERLGIDQKKIREVDFCSAIDTDTCYPREDSVEYGPGHPVIGTFRRPRGEKILENYRTFLDAIALLKNDGVNFHSVIGGLYEDSIHRSEIQKMVRDRDLTTHIELLPMVKKEEMPRYLSGLDIYVDIPYPDYDMVAIGTTSKEAMACGSAYITMDNSGSSKQWYTSNSEMLINENRPRELSNKMNSILGSDKIMTEMQNESIELVGNRYSITAIQKKFVNSCESVMNR